MKNVRLRPPFPASCCLRFPWAHCRAQKEDGRDLERSSLVGGASLPLCDITNWSLWHAPRKLAQMRDKAASKCSARSGGPNAGVYRRLRRKQILRLENMNTVNNSSNHPINADGSAKYKHTRRPPSAFGQSRSIFEHQILMWNLSADLKWMRLLCSRGAASLAASRPALCVSLFVMQQPRGLSPCSGGHVIQFVFCSLCQCRPYFMLMRSRLIVKRVWGKELNVLNLFEPHSSACLSSWMLVLLGIEFL